MEQKGFSRKLILRICNSGNLLKVPSYNNTILCDLCSIKELKMYIR